MKSLYDVVFSTITGPKGNGNIHPYVQPLVENLRWLSALHFSARRKMGSALRWIRRTNVKKFPNNERHKLTPAPGAVECTPGTSQLAMVPAANAQPAPGHGILLQALQLWMHILRILKYCLQFELVETITITNVRGDTPIMLSESPPLP